MRFFKNLSANENFKEVISGSFASLITKAIGIILNYLLIYFISTKIGVEYVGFYNILLISLFLATILGTGGLYYAIIPLVQQFSLNRKKLYAKSLWSILALVSLLLLILYFLFPVINHYFFSDFNIKKGFLIIALLLFLYVFMLFNIEFLRGNKKIIISESLRNISFPLIILVGILFTAPFFEDEFHLILGSVFAATLLTLILSVYFSAKVKNNTIERNPLIPYKTLLKTATPLMIMGLSSFSLSESSLFFLKYFHDIKAVGNFTIIYKISIISCLVFTISSAIIGPKIAELFWGENKIDLRKMIVFSFKMISFLSFPIFIIFSLFPSFFLQIFNLSAQFSTALLIMLVGQFLYGITAITGLFLMVTNKQKAYKNIYIIAAISNLILCYILIPKYGVLGASITVAVSWVFLNLLCIFYIYKKKLL